MLLQILNKVEYFSRPVYIKTCLNGDLITLKKKTYIYIYFTQTSDLTVGGK